MHQFESADPVRTINCGSERIMFMFPILDKLNEFQKSREIIGKW